MNPSYADSLREERSSQGFHGSLEGFSRTREDHAYSLVGWERIITSSAGTMAALPNSWLLKQEHEPYSVDSHFQASTSEETFQDVDVDDGSTHWKQEFFTDVVVFREGGVEK